MSSHGPRASLLPFLHLHTNTVCAAPVCSGRHSRLHYRGTEGWATVGRPMTGPDGKGFLSGKGGERCLSPAFFHQKNLFKAALTQLKTSHRPFKQGHCSGHHASDVPTWDRNWKSPLGRLPQLLSSSGRTVMSQVSESDRMLFSTDTPNVGSISQRPVYGD